MLEILVATSNACLQVGEDGKIVTELSGRRIGPLLPQSDGTCLGVVDEKEIWERNAAGLWSFVADAGVPIQSIAVAKGSIYLGGDQAPCLLRMRPTASVERVESFDRVPGRREWFAGGPPLGVRSIASAMEGEVLLAGVHVGGIPRSSDGGASWTPTIPVMFDVHEIRPHPTRPEMVAAAAAVGLCVSTDAGETWRVWAPAMKELSSLAVGALEGEFLFSVQSGPFAKRSQIWRWRIDNNVLEQVRDGLPDWLEGKVDTGWLACRDGRAAVIDGQGNLWLSESGSTGWSRMMGTIPSAQYLSILCSA